MSLRSDPRLPAVLAGLVIVGVGLSGCVATTVAGATFGAAKVAVGTAATVTKVAVGTTAKVAGGAVRLANKAGAHPAKKEPPPQ